MFKVSILDIEKAETFYSQELAANVVLPTEEGELTILDFHQPIVFMLRDGAIKIDEQESISIKKGIAKVQGSELVIMVEK